MDLDKVDTEINTACIFNTPTDNQQTDQSYVKIMCPLFICIYLHLHFLYRYQFLFTHSYMFTCVHLRTG